MRVKDALRRSAVGIGPDHTMAEAAEIMDTAGVGALAVLDGERLVGIVTDRDLVRRGMARGLPSDARVDMVMSTDVVTIDAGEDLHDAFARFRTHAIRRLPVMESGRFVGMVAVDDLLIDLAADLGDLVRPITGEVIFGHHDPPVPVTT